MTVKIIKNAGKDLLKSIQERKENSSLVTLSSDVLNITKDECKSLCDNIGLKFKDGMEDRVIEFRFTDATVDRHNEVVLPNGVDLKSFRKDPVILSQHDSHRFPIGKSLETKFNKDTNDITGKILFFDDEIDRSGLAEDTFRMVKAGAMKNGSIGFTAKSADVRLASPEERKLYGLEEFGVIFDKIELREFSIVTIPANPNATQIGNMKGAFRPDTLAVMKDKGLSDDIVKMLVADIEDTHPLLEIAKGVELDPTEDDVAEPETSPEPETEEDNEPDTSGEPEPTSEEDVVEVEDDSKKSGSPSMTITLHGSDSDVINQAKLKLCEIAIAKGYDVSVLDVPTDNEIVKAGAVLSKKNKSIVESTLSTIDDLKTQLTDLLKSADKDVSDDVSEDDSDVTPSDKSEASYAKLYDVVENMSDTINK